MKKRVIMTGATGMVGGEVLNSCLGNEEIENITSLVRRPSGIKNPKLNEVLVEDFCDLSELKDHFRDMDLVLYCLAVYLGRVALLFTISIVVLAV